MFLIADPDRMSDLEVKQLKQRIAELEQSIAESATERGTTARQLLGMMTRTVKAMRARLSALEGDQAQSPRRWC